MVPILYRGMGAITQGVEDLKDAGHLQESRKVYAISGCFARDAAMKLQFIT
jgi:hypothetical protein